MNSPSHQNNQASKSGVLQNKAKPVVQAKLSVNEPGDIYEQEADAMADRVMRMSSNQTVKPVTGLISRSLQRKCTHCEEEEKRKPVMRKAEAGNAGMPVSSSFASTLNASKSGGTPLPEGTRNFMENAFSADFSSVRVHTGNQASKMNKEINAKAFTYGNDIYFKDGKYSPQTNSGKELLAHELTHTLQQSEGTIIQRYGEDDVDESEAPPAILDFTGNRVEPLALSFLQNMRILRPDIFEEYDIRVIVQIPGEGIVFFNEDGEQLDALIPINFLVEPGEYNVGWSTAGPILYPLDQAGRGSYTGSILINSNPPRDFYENWNMSSTFLVVPSMQARGGSSIEGDGEVEHLEERPSLPPWASELNREVQSIIRQLRRSPETNPAQATSLPDRVVVWVDRRGPHLNVWIDQAVRSITLREEETAETTLDRIIETVNQIEETRDADQSVEVVDGAEQTGFTPDETEGVDGNPAQVQQGAMLTEEQLTSPDSTANTPAYGSDIVTYDLAEDDSMVPRISGQEYLIAVLGANNRLSMQLDFSTAGSRLIDQVGARMQYIRYYWEVINVTGLSPVEQEEGVEDTLPGQGEMINPLSGEIMRFSRDMRAIQEDTDADINDAANDPYLFITWPDRAAYLALIGLSNDIRFVGSVISSYINLLTTPSNEIDVGWSEPGEYIIRCVASPFYEEDSQVRRASSVAVKAVRVVNINERATQLVDKELTDIDSLYDRLDSTTDETERQLLLTQIVELERIQSQSAVERVGDQLGQVETQLSALREIEQNSGSDGLSPAARLLRVQLELSGVTILEMREHLTEQQRVLSRMQAFGQRQERDMIQSYRPRVVLVSEENGSSYQMIMILGESTDSAEGAWHYKLIDMTSPATQDEYEGSSSAEGMDGKNEALRNAFVHFRERNGYGRGTIAIRLPDEMPDGLSVEPTMRSAPGDRDRFLRRLQDLATAAEIAGLVISGPVGMGIGLAGGAAGAIIAGEHLWRRYHADRFDWDFATFMDITAIVGGAIPFLGVTSQRMGRFVYYVGIAQLGQSVLVIPVQLEQQLREIEMDISLSPGERSARRAEAFLQAIRSGIVTTISAAQMIEHGSPAADESGESSPVSELPEIDSSAVNIEIPPADVGGDTPGVPVETTVSLEPAPAAEAIDVRPITPESPVRSGNTDQLVRELVLHRDRMQQQLNRLRRSSPEATLLGLEIADINDALEGLRLAHEGAANAADLDRNAMELNQHLRSIDDSAPVGERFWEVDPMPDATVMQHADPTDLNGSQRMYDNSIAYDPFREAAIYRNTVTGEYIIVQGEETVVSVGGGESPASGGRQQAWKDLLNDGQDLGNWELEAHYHPLDPDTGQALFTNMIPSGGGGDIGVVVSESIAAGGGSRSSRIDFRLHDGSMDYTIYSYIPGVENPIVLDVPSGTGLRTRIEFPSVEAYHAWASEQLGGADMGTIPAHISDAVLGSRPTDVPPPPEAVESDLPSISPPAESIVPSAPRGRRTTETTAARAERLAREESMAEYERRRLANGGRESITDFARHGQTFNSILQTLRNMQAALISNSQGDLLPEINEEVLQQNVDHFFMENEPLMGHLRAILEVLSQSPNGARNTEGWSTIRDSLFGGDDALLNYILTGRYRTGRRGGHGARQVGARKPDLVTFDLENGLVQVIDWTTDIVGDNTVHNLKTRFYIEVMRAILGDAGPQVSGMDVRIQLDSTGLALDPSLTTEGPLIE